MRRDVSRHSGRLQTVCAGTLLGVALTLTSTATALAQMPQPNIPNTNQRSGLVTRFVPNQPGLPPDKHRDTFYDTRWADHPNSQLRHPNCPANGGLYGLRLKTPCTKCVYPYFYGSPGQDTVTADCRAKQPHVLRVVEGLVHPFRPVGMYYDQGAYVPIYDLDPLVPGPGPDLWPHFFNWHGG